MSADQVIGDFPAGDQLAVSEGERKSLIEGRQESIGVAGPGSGRLFHTVGPSLGKSELKQEGLFKGKAFSCRIALGNGLWPMDMFIGHNPAGDAMGFQD